MNRVHSRSGLEKLNMTHEMRIEESTWLSRIPWKKSLILFLIGLGLLFIYVTFANFTQVVQILMAADPVLLGLAILSIILGSFLYTIAWQKLLQCTELPSSFARALYYGYVGLFFDQIIPIGGSAGIVVRAHLIREDRKAYKETDIWGRALTSQTAMKIAVTLWIVVAGVLGFVYLLLQFPLTRYTTIAVVFFLFFSVMGIIVLLLLSIHPEAPIRLAHGILNVLGRFFPFIKPRIEEFRPRAEENARSFSKGMRLLIQQKNAPLFSLTFCLLYYLSYILAAWLSFVALGLRQPVLVICAITTVALIIQFLGVGLPGGLGVKEIVTAELFAVVIGSTSSLNTSGIAPRAAAAAASIMVNVLMFWVPLFLSSFFAIKALPILRKAFRSIIEVRKQDVSSATYDNLAQNPKENDSFPLESFNRRRRR